MNKSNHLRLIPLHIYVHALPKYISDFAVAAHILSFAYKCVVSWGNLNIHDGEYDGTDAASDHNLMN